MSTITRDATVTTGELLTDDMLQRFDERAPVYDRENRFFTEDFDELRAPGYLLAAVPTELGGSGLTLNEVMRLQQRLAYHARHRGGREHAPVLDRPGRQPGPLR